RRWFLAAAAAGVGATALAPGATRAEAVKTKAKIVVAGGGAAGLSVASRLMRGLDGAEIVVVEPRSEHYYQPGFTLVGAGIKPARYVTLQTADYLASGVRWVQDRVAEFDPVGNKVVTEKGTALPYDFLVVTTGLVLDYGAIEGMDRSLIGREGIASVYAGPDAAAASWAVLQKFMETGGDGLFGRPETEMKCAGAPIKQTFLADDHLRRAEMRTKTNVVYNAHNKTLFSVPPVNTKLLELFDRQDIKINFSHVLTKIDPAKRIATYQTPDGPVELEWDFINLIPPMRAPHAIRNSPLPWQGGPFAADGWIEVDKKTLRHIRFPNVFGVGDINGVPKGKTAASVKWQTPVAVDHLIAAIAGKAGTEAYNGYTSCPLITQIGQAMLVEFDYENRLTPSFPFIDPLMEHWLPWIIKEKALKANYTAMLRGMA
ncbi:MAG: FAD/NAD(P)-binding oxidoreductase, partial [Pseudomonadota bacterium]